MRVRQNKVVGSFPQQKIGNYTVDTSHLLGQGSFSRIYHGRSSTGTEVAVKVIDLHMVNSQGLRKFLEHEIQINSSVDHPYVLKCFEISYTPTHCYLVTEYCPEGDLQRYVKSKGKLTEAEALRLLRQLVAGLKYLHEHQILHRDLKSSNVFIKRGDVRIADFGLSHCFATGKTMDKLLIGTPAYMAPYSFKSDVWALGNIFVEMLTGNAPFMNSQSIQQLQTILQANIYLQLNGISKESCGLIEQMLQKDQRARMSITELYNRLNAKGPGPTLRQNKLSRVQPMNPLAVCKLRFMGFLLNCVEQLESWGHSELVQLLVRLASDIFSKKESFLDQPTETKLKSLANNITAFQNSHCRVKRKLDLSYLTFYVEQLEYELSEMGSRTQAQAVEQLLFMLELYQDGWERMAATDWRRQESENRQQQSTVRRGLMAFC